MSDFTLLDVIWGIGKLLAASIINDSDDSDSSSSKDSARYKAAQTFQQADTYLNNTVNQKMNRAKIILEEKSSEMSDSVLQRNINRARETGNNAALKILEQEAERRK